MVGPLKLKLQYPVHPWTAKRSNQSTLKEISPEYSLEGLMLMLKFQYFGYLMQRTDSFEKTLMLGKIEGRRRRGRRGWDGWMASLATCRWVWASSGIWWQTGKPGVLKIIGSQSLVQLKDWTEPSCCLHCFLICKRKWKSLSRVWLFETPWTIQPMEFSRSEYWSG